MTNGRPQNFFVLVERDAEATVRRLRLNRDAQTALSNIFNEAHAALLHGDVRRIPYDGLYKAERDEILVAEPFDLPEDVVAAVREPTLFPTLNLRQEEDPGIKAIFTGDTTANDVVILFQAFQKDQYLHNKRFSISFTQDLFRPLQDPGLNIRGELHAVYRQGGLYFRNDWWVKRMLDLSDHYREATNTDIEAFIDLAAVYVDDREQLFEHADTWVRKRIAMINDRRILEDYSLSMIREEARGLEIDLVVNEADDGEKIVLPNNKKELKDILRFLNEDMYAGPITDKHFVSSNKRPLNEG